MTKPLTPEQLDKLPKWAQEHIRCIERERDGANDCLSQRVANQEPSPFYVSEYVVGQTNAVKRMIPVPGGYPLINVDAADAKGSPHEHPLFQVKVDDNFRRGTRLLSISTIHFVRVLPGCSNVVYLESYK